MLILLTIIHFLVCIFLVVVVLLQSGKAADLAGAFGGMGSQTAFGPRGTATLLSKATAVAAGVFMVTSLTLAIISTKSGGGASSVLERSAPKTTKPANQPATPTGAQPTVTLTPEVDGKQGPSKTVPMDVNKLPRVDEKGNPVPAGQQPAVPKK